MGNISITARDIDYMMLIYAYDKVGLDQLCKRHDVSYERCRQRVRRLVEAGYLTVTRIPSWSGIGSGKYLLGLAREGKRLLAEHLKVPLASLRHLTTTATPYLANHHLAICDWRLDLELSALKRGVEVAEWVLERELKRQGGFPIADGRFTLQVGSRKQGFELEMDMGTVPVARIKEKLAAYMKLEEKRPVLWVVPDERRQMHLVEWGSEISQVTHLDPTIHWVSVRGSDPLSAVWQIPTVKELHDLLPG